MPAINTLKQTNLRQVNISEWCSDKGYIKILNGMERLLLSTHFRKYIDDTADIAERAHAAAKAVLLVVSDKDGNPLFSEAQEDDIVKASFDPVLRIFDMALDPAKLDDTIAKN